MGDLETQTHWDAAYADGDSGVSWQQDVASTSLELINLVASRSSSIIDVGGGSSTLVDGLLAAGCENVTVLDVSPKGMQLARERLGADAELVEWVTSDLVRWQPAKIYDVWHDRAVLHFLTSADDARAYRDRLLAALRPGGHAVIGVFAEDGPEKCSGLPVRRYAEADLAELLGDEFETVTTLREEHLTPSGKAQRFNWIVAKRR